jgi:transposase
MSYFLKKAELKGRTYISICECFYSHAKKGAAHKTYKSLGSIETLKTKGMDDPISFFQEEVDRLNAEARSHGIRQISDKSPNTCIGYFPFAWILNKLNVKKYIDYFKLVKSFRFDLYDLISSLIYARVVCPCSKSKTFHDVLPSLHNSYNYSYDQLLDGLSFIGNDYEKFIEIFTVQVNNVYGINTKETYFDCTNFYFEIDKEDDFRRKGPSKENRKDPIIGLGLLLDSNLIPAGMKLYPGNESEKPVLRDVLSRLKSFHNITGKTIHVADKGLNCAENIAFSKRNGDGYLFSKTVKGLSAKEKVWVLLDNDLQIAKDSSGNIEFYYKSCIDEFPYTIEYNGKNTTINFTEKRLLTYNPTLAKKQRLEILKIVEKAKNLSLSLAKKEDYGESAKYINFTDGDGNKAKTTLNQVAIDKDLRFAGYNLLITSETNMSDRDMYDIYHNLWRIEESFKIMKADLDARPVFLQKENSIKGHFLICYLTVLLERILQFKLLENKYSTSVILNFIKNFQITKTENKHINTTVLTDFIKDISSRFSLPLTNYFLTDTQIKSIFNHKI